ncbi:MAG: circadian clock protein KaiB [Rhodospirillaceae bacterium]|nr:circadian clock protein KaiB [Rhodospirillaceae bacterium]
MYRLILFITGGTSASDAAVRNLRALCRLNLADRHELDIVDVLLEPGRAAGEGIVATPTLVRVLPEPQRRVFGDLADSCAVMAALELDASPGAGAAEEP